MNMFYDPKKKSSKIWVPIFFIMLPILLTLLLFQIGRMIADNEKIQTENVEVDIFD